MSRRPHLLILISCVLVFIANLAAHADAVDDWMKAEIAQRHIPGASVAVIKDGVVVKTAGYGLADIEHNVPVRPDTAFKIGSVSKQFIAAGIMVLVQDGKVALDDKVTKFVPGAPNAWEGITVRHLLTHTSGLIREGPGFDPYKIQPDIDVIKTAYSQPLQSKPGEKWAYSNLGYYVLAEIIRSASARSWGDFLHERVFAPLGMTNTRPTVVADIIPNRADGYSWMSEKWSNGENWPTVRPSGAFLSTAQDMAKWEMALLGDRILNESSKKAMWTPVMLNNGQRYPYGFGWELEDFPANAPQPTGVPMIRHEGVIVGFRAGYFRFPKHGLSVIILTNLQQTVIEGLGAGLALQYVPALLPGAGSGK